MQRGCRRCRRCRGQQRSRPHPRAARRPSRRRGGRPSVRLPMAIPTPLSIPRAGPSVRQDRTRPCRGAPTNRRPRAHPASPPRLPPSPGGRRRFPALPGRRLVGGRSRRSASSRAPRLRRPFSSVLRSRSEGTGEWRPGRPAATGRRRRLRRETVSDPAAPPPRGPPADCVAGPRRGRHCCEPDRVTRRDVGIDRLHAGGTTSSRRSSSRAGRRSRRLRPARFGHGCRWRGSQPARPLRW